MIIVIRSKVIIALYLIRNTIILEVFVMIIAGRIVILILLFLILRKLGLILIIKLKGVKSRSGINGLNICIYFWFGNFIRALRVSELSSLFDVYIIIFSMSLLAGLELSVRTIIILFVMILLILLIYLHVFIVILIVIWIFLLLLYVRNMLSVRKIYIRRVKGNGQFLFHLFIVN